MLVSGEGTLRSLVKLVFLFRQNGQVAGAVRVHFFGQLHDNDTWANDTTYDPDVDAFYGMF